MRLLGRLLGRYEEAASEVKNRGERVSEDIRDGWQQAAQQAVDIEKPQSEEKLVDLGTININPDKIGLTESLNAEKIINWVSDIYQAPNENLATRAKSELKNHLEAVLLKLDKQFYDSPELIRDKNHFISSIDVLEHNQNHDDTLLMQFYLQINGIKSPVNIPMELRINHNRIVMQPQGHEQEKIRGTTISNKHIEHQEK